VPGRAQSGYMEALRMGVGWGGGVTAAYHGGDPPPQRVRQRAPTHPRTHWTCRSRVCDGKLQ